MQKVALLVLPLGWLLGKANPNPPAGRAGVPLVGQLKN